MLNRVLILTDCPADASPLRSALVNAADGAFEVVWERCLSAGLERVAKCSIDAIIVDLSLPDSTGIATFDQLLAAAPHTPIMILGDDAVVKDAVRRGAQGYLSKSQFASNLVPQAMRSIIQHRLIELELYKERSRADIALNSISDAVICTDILGNVDYLNIAGERLTGWSREDACGRPIAEVFRIINGETRQLQRNPVELVLRNDEPMGLAADTVLVRKDGSEAAIEDSASPIHDFNGRLTGVVIVFHDVTATQAMTMKMAHLAQHDFLTNLPNRVLLNDRIERAIQSAKRRDAQLALLFLDLDNFKQINDSLGHATGDRLLQSVALRLVNCVRGSDTVSRQGGDEFVILFAEDKHKMNAALIAEKILAALTLPHEVALRELHVTGSIGISVYPADGQDAETLIKAADTAMYIAKQKGRNSYQFFSSDMNVLAVERQLIDTDLRHALQRQQFTLHYQPKVNLDTGAITGAEALLRWSHAEWGTVYPARFISIAEDSGLIVPIGRWVLREACEQAKQWSDIGRMVPLSIAVNISALEFRQKNFLEILRSILDDTGLSPHRLELEITESVLMQDVETSRRILRSLKDIGVQLAVDDFGTGYSSLSYLNQFPIDVLKIDQSFVSEIGAMTNNGVIASAVISMGNSLNLKVVAEGVENHAQLAFLKAQHCEEGQGFLFSGPLIAKDFASLTSNYI